jgi:hypothetical protein
MIKPFLQSNWTFAGMAALVIGWAGVHLWPGSWWLTVRHVLAFDAPAGAEVLMDVDRTIHRPFQGDWRVLVRRMRGDGWEIVCTAGGSGDYRTDAVLPDPQTLRWWTDGQCPYPPEGQIMVSIIWRIDAGLAGSRSVLGESNIFTVRPAE